MRIKNCDFIPLLTPRKIYAGVDRSGRGFNPRPAPGPTDSDPLRPAREIKNPTPPK